MRLRVVRRRDRGISGGVPLMRPPNPPRATELVSGRPSGPLLLSEECVTRRAAESIDYEAAYRRSLPGRLTGWLGEGHRTGPGIPARRGGSTGSRGSRRPRELRPKAQIEERGRGDALQVDLAPGAEVCIDRCVNGLPDDPRKGFQGLVAELDSLR